MSKKKKTNKKWVITKNEKEDKIKNHPEWATKKPREEIILKPTPPNALKEWLTNK